LTRITFERYGNAANAVTDYPHGARQRPHDYFVSLGVRKLRLSGPKDSSEPPLLHQIQRAEHYQNAAIRDGLCNRD
jgi:hypothetical protein